MAPGKRLLVLFVIILMFEDVAFSYSARFKLSFKSAMPPYYLNNPANSPMLTTLAKHYGQLPIIADKARSLLDLIDK